MGEGKLTPLTTPTPLNRQSRNIAHVITSTIYPHKPHLVNIASVVTSPHIAKVTTQFYLFLSSLYAKSFHGPRAQAVEPILTCDTSADAYSRRIVPFGGQNTIFSHLHPQNPQKPNFWAHIMVSLREIHIRITAWCIEIRRWNLARCLTLPSTLSAHKSFSERNTAGG